MIEVKNNFMGGMDQDTSLHELGKNQYVDALNITRDAIAPNQDRVVSNITSNRLVNYPFPSGNNVCIGSYADTLKNRTINFFFNSDGFHTIHIYNNTTRTITKLIESKTDSGGVDILQFNQFAKIIHIEVIHRLEGDLLFWTDGQVTPKGLIIDKILANGYGVGALDVAFIEAAKRPPIAPPIVAYGDDATKTVNALRGKLYQLKYKFVYDDFSESTWSPISTTPIPANLVGTDVDLDATKNNFISAAVTTGKKNVLKIKIAARENIGAAWGDFYLVDVLVKSDLGIGDDGVYTYNWYNNGIYPSIDVKESTLLFDWFPQLAKSMCLANGNVLVYGAITEGYDPLTRSQMNVQMSCSLVPNTGTQPTLPSFTWTQVGHTFVFTVGPTVTPGSRYRVIMTVFPGGIGSSVQMCDYTTIPGDTAASVASALFTSTAQPAYRNSLVGGTSGQFILNQVNTGFPADRVETAPLSYTPPIPGTTINSTSTYNWFSRYRYGLVYFDKWGRTNGVMTYVNATADDNDFEVETGNFALSASTPKSPVIAASILHNAPSWAVKYSWVRTKNLAIDNFLYYATSDFQIGSGVDAGYLFFGLGNLDYYYNNNNKFIYNSISSFLGISGTATATNYRIRPIAAVTISGYGGAVYNNDFEIQGVVQRLSTGGDLTKPGDTYSYIKVKAPVGAFSFSTTMMVMIYAPAKSNSRVQDNEYFEFGEFYDCYVSGGVNYHRGQQQDQTAIQPATFQFISGDTYFRQRTFFTSITFGVFAGAYPSGNIYIVDSNYSDFYLSAVNSNGRAQVADPYAKQTYFPTTLRFGQEFEQNTAINGFPRFYPENFMDINRDYGDILKLKIRDQYMRVGQKLKIGDIPVELQILKSGAGNGSNVTVSDKLLNPIQYYEGAFGVGDAPESWTSFNFADYFCDTYRATICRLSRDGIVPISKLYKMNDWASTHLPARTGNYKIYGAYDPKSDNYIAAIEATGSDNAYTISFDEENNQFESFLSYNPEMMVVLGTTIISFQSGGLWTHDDSTYNNFYGVQYDSNITAVFNTGGIQKRSFKSLTEVATDIWDCPLIYTNVMSYALQRQESNLIVADFETKESNFTSPFRHDIWSIGGLINGDDLKGNYMAIQLRKQNATMLTNLAFVAVHYIDSPLLSR